MCGRVHSRQTARRIFCRADCKRIHAVQTTLQVALRAVQSRRWESSCQRAVDCDIAGCLANHFWRRPASCCCFFNSRFEGGPSVAVGCSFCCESCVACCSIRCPRCRLPAMLDTCEAGMMSMDPSRRHVIETLSLRARRAAWRRSCHWRSLKEPRDALVRAECWLGAMTLNAQWNDAQWNAEGHDDVAQREL